MKMAINNTILSQSGTFEKLPNIELTIIIIIMTKIVSIKIDCNLVLREGYSFSIFRI
jgi:hypothetical protein